MNPEERTPSFPQLRTASPEGPVWNLTPLRPDTPGVPPHPLQAYLQGLPPEARQAWNHSLHVQEVAGETLSWVVLHTGEIWDAVHAFRAGLRVGTRLRDLHAPRIALHALPPHGTHYVEGLCGGLFSVSWKRNTPPPPDLHVPPEVPVDRLRPRLRGWLQARWWASLPGNLLSPPVFAEEARQVLQEAGVQVTVHDERWLQAEGFGGILAVARGSHQPPRLVVADYAPDEARDTVVLVGKAVTFDTGGINLKRSGPGLVSMRQDKTGGAVVLGTVLATALARLPVRVVGVVPMVENMPGGGATRPGDVIRMWDGTTVEITNTDAEGRLILADALAYAAHRYPGAPLVDVATLTGAALVISGHARAPVMGTRPDLVERLHRLGETIGEPLVPLPMDPEIRGLLRSSLADLANSAMKREAGTVVAGWFLRRFVPEDRAWAHLDIAGTGIGSEGGPSPAFGVRLLTTYLETLARA